MDRARSFCAWNASRRAQDAPRRLRDASKTLQDAPKTLQDAPKTPQEASKTLQDAPRGLQDAILVDFGSQNGGMLDLKINEKTISTSKSDFIGFVRFP